MNLSPPLELLRTRTRRHFLKESGVSLASMFLAQQAGAQTNPLLPKAPMMPAKAKSVIYLHMAGSPSQLDLFSWKPELVKYDGKDCPEEYLKGKRFAFIKGVPKMLGTPFRFSQHGQTGLWLSELLPELGSVADEITMVHSMTTEQFNHAPAQLFVQTGSPRFGAASLGSWVTYGLGTQNQNLPGFVVLLGGGNNPDGGKSLWGSGFLPSVYQGVQCRTSGDPVLYLSDPDGVSRNMRRKTLDAIRDLNAMESARLGDPETEARVAQYELAYRMQTSVPEAMDISKEPQHIRDLYGAAPGEARFANNCLLARRLVEKGVRFVQIYEWGWDHHGSLLSEDLRHALPRKVKSVDRPIAALLKDLKQRGMLDSTLVVFGGEFGRTPMREIRPGQPGGFLGRDHHPHGFNMWMAGGGFKRGFQYGATDEIGYYATENKITVRDLQATILHQLGLDPYKLHYPFMGLNQRLIGPTDEGRVVKDLLA
jgi:hypothetical protein